MNTFNKETYFRGLFSKIKNNLLNKSPNIEMNYKSYMYSLQSPIWTERGYAKFADEAYIKNVIAYRSMTMIAQSATSVPWRLYKKENEKFLEIKHHPLLELLQKPNPLYAGAEFFENIYTYKMISGNAFIQVIRGNNKYPKELHILRPDRVSIIPGRNGLPLGYSYKIGEKEKIFPLNNITGQSDILHLRSFHPLDDWYGLSPIEAAAYSIDQHNQAAMWNQALLQNGARPSGALIVKTGHDNIQTQLSEEQYVRLKEEVNEKFTGFKNAGKPLLLEGGLDWKEMSLTPKDMDFIEAKNSAARDIALAFGVPPQLLGIPGDNTYSNMQEARLALWEETILPLLDHMMDALNNWLVPMFDSNLKITYDKDEISALAPRNEKIWLRIENASFLTENEKRAMVGLSPLKDGDRLRRNDYSS